MIQWIRRQLYKLWDHDGALYRHAIHGKFRVEYPDGQLSQRFSYRVAKNYAKMFGGKVIDAF